MSPEARREALVVSPEQLALPETAENSEEEPAPSLASRGESVFEDAEARYDTAVPEECEYEPEGERNPPEWQLVAPRGERLAREAADSKY